MRLSQKMQRSLLPSIDVLDNIKERCHIDIASYFSPSDRLGGDFWQVIELSDKKFGLFLCDFSGHGLSAALNTFRMHTLVHQLKGQVKNPSDFLRLLNLELCQLLPRGQYATFFFCIFDTNAQTLSYAGAGSPAPFLKTRNGVLLLSTQGLPLGISPDAKYDDYKIDFCPGDKLILYSDALTEEMNVDGLRLGTEGLLSLLQTVFEYKDIREAVSELMQLFFKMLPPPPQDDVTLVWVEGLPLPTNRKKR
jgi:sigma-B regulation protein RsbU (phosphoserine phosphatase)